MPDVVAMLLATRVPEFEGQPRLMDDDNWNQRWPSMPTLASRLPALTSMNWLGLLFTICALAWRMLTTIYRDCTVYAARPCTASKRKQQDIGDSHREVPIGLPDYNISL